MKASTAQNMTFVVRCYDDVEAANNTEPLIGLSRVTLPTGRIASTSINLASKDVVETREKLRKIDSHR